MAPNLDHGSLGTSTSVSTNGTRTSRGRTAMTNRIAAICVAALHRGLPQRVIHASDDTTLKMGAYFDLAADLLGMPRPPRLGRDEAARVLSPLQLSFMSESRRLVNRRLKRELRVRLRYPTVAEGLRNDPPGVDP